MRRIVRATNCPCDELSVRRIVRATNCPRRIVRATNCPDTGFSIVSTSLHIKTIGLMQKYPPIFKKMFLNDVALLWMRGFHAYDTASVS